MAITAAGSAPDLNRIPFLFTRMNKFVFQSFEAGLSEQENSMKKEGKIRREALGVSVILRIKLALVQFQIWHFEKELTNPFLNSESEIE